MTPTTLLTTLRGRLLWSLTAAGVALSMPAISVAGTLSLDYPSTCTVTRSGASPLTFNASMRAQVTLPNRVLPGGRYGATDIRQTVSANANAVKTLSVLGSGARLRGIRELSGSGGLASTPALTSASSAFEIATWDLDPARTTYRPTAWQLLHPALPDVFTAPTAGTSATVRLNTAFTGQLLVDQWFGQASYPVSCTGNWSSGVAVSISNFPPTISSITPNSGPAAGGTQVTITGSDLDTSRVAFGDRKATIVSRSSKQLVVTSPPGSGDVAVVAMTPAGLTSSTSMRFVYAGSSATAPAITALSPSTLFELIGGQVNVSGTALSTATRVTLNGASVPFSVVGAMLSINAPGLSRGTYDLVVQTPSGTATAPLTYRRWL